MCTWNQWLKSPHLLGLPQKSVMEWEFMSFTSMKNSFIMSENQFCVTIILHYWIIDDLWMCRWLEGGHRPPFSQQNDQNASRLLTWHHSPYPLKLLIHAPLWRSRPGQHPTLTRTYNWSIIENCYILTDIFDFNLLFFSGLYCTSSQGKSNWNQARPIASNSYNQIWALHHDTSQTRWKTELLMKTGPFCSFFQQAVLFQPYLNVKLDFNLIN